MQFSVNPNREIYNRHYSASTLEEQPLIPYQRYLIELRRTLIDRFGRGKDVLDLCCGTGAYLLPILENVHSGIGVDFSSNLLGELCRNVHGAWPNNLGVVEADAEVLPFADEVFDLVFSYKSLYSVPNLEAVIRQVQRILRPGGHAVLELGNLYSINSIVSYFHHLRSGWARPYHVPLRKILHLLSSYKLTVVERHAFQVMPMYGASLWLLPLYPVLCPIWQKWLGVRVGDKILDSWISGSWPLRYIAFRHLIVVQKAESLKAI